VGSRQARPEVTTTISLADRVAIVTGGGRGLGAAYAHELARRGAAVIVHELLNAPLYAVLTRPDGHVAWVDTSGSATGLDQALTKWIGTPQGSRSQPAR
jgi:NAD(P)-dependent dehydrogenase (short-subunit alcohol dehydrogenase family)